MLAAQLRAIGHHEPDAHRHRSAAIGAGAGQHVAVEPKIALDFAGRARRRFVKGWNSWLFWLLLPQRLIYRGAAAAQIWEVAGRQL